MNPTDRAIINTIWKQISVQTKMAVGARQVTVVGSDDEYKISFKVHSKPYRFIEVEYDYSMDLYNVEYFRLKRNDFSRISLEKTEQVYADQLSEIIYHMVNK